MGHSGELCQWPAFLFKAKEGYNYMYEILMKRGLTKDVSLYQMRPLAHQRGARHGKKFILH